MEGQQLIDANKAFAKFFNGRVRKGKGAQEGKTYAEFRTNGGWYVGSLCFQYDTLFGNDWNKIMTLVELISKVGSTIVQINTTYCKITPIVYNLTQDCMVWKPAIEHRGGRMIENVIMCLSDFMSKYHAFNKTELSNEHKLIN